MVITLLDGTLVETSDVRFEPSTHHFYWDSGAAGWLDVTNTMTRAQKLMWPDFDPQKDNLRLFTQAHPSANPVSSTSPTAIFFDQIYNEPLRAPIEQAERVVQSTGDAISKATGIQALLVMGAIGIGLYFWLGRK